MILGATIKHFWMCETGTGQQVAQLHVSYITMMMSRESIFDLESKSGNPLLLGKA